MSLKFKNCIILATGEDGKFSVLKDNVLCIKDKIIEYIGSEENAPECEIVKDMGGAVLMPGLINAHGHGPMTLLRGVGGGLALQDWLEKAIFPIEDKLTPEDIAVGERWAIMEMLASGTTCVSEMYDFPRSSWEILKASGIKGNVCRVGLSFSETEEIPKNRFDECVSIVRDLKDENDRVISEFCLHSEYLTKESFVRKIAEVNSTLHANVNVHVSETKREHEECKARHGGLTPIQYLDKFGILDENTYAELPYDSLIQATEAYVKEMNSAANYWMWRTQRQMATHRGNMDHLAHNLAGQMRVYRPDDPYYPQTIQKIILNNVPLGKLYTATFIKE